MAEVQIKFKMTPEQFKSLYGEYLDLSQPNRPYFLNFQQFLDWKYSDLIEKKIDEVTNA